MDCPLRSGHDLAEAYVAGTLPEAEQDAYEQHFFSCSMCLAQVQTLQELADRLRQHAGRRGGAPRRRPRAGRRPRGSAWRSRPAWSRRSAGGGRAA